MSCRYVLFRKAEGEEEDRETFIVFCCGSRRERKDQMDRNGAEFAFALGVEEKEESMCGGATGKQCTLKMYKKYLQQDKRKLFEYLFLREFSS